MKSSNSRPSWISNCKFLEQHLVSKLTKIDLIILTWAKTNGWKQKNKGSK